VLKIVKVAEKPRREVIGRQTEREDGKSEEYARLDIQLSRESLRRLRAADLAPLPCSDAFHCWRALS